MAYEQARSQANSQAEIKTCKKRVGLYGGTFNPVHVSHLIVGDQVKWALELDHVAFVPDDIPPHVQKKEAISAQDRVNMLNLAIEDNPNFGLDLTEIQRGGISYTYDTIVNLKQRHPDTEYYFILGGDMVEDLPTWHRID